jgi:hypothetical protein
VSASWKLRELAVPVSGAFAFVLSTLVGGRLAFGWPLALILGIPAAVCLPIWLHTTYRKPLEGNGLVLYFLNALLLHVHVSEEYVSGFPERFGSLFALSRFDATRFLVVFSFAGGALWLAAGIGLLYRRPLANFFAVFLFVSAGLGEAVHYLFPLLEGGRYHYFPGMGTAWLLVACGGLGLRYILFSDPCAEKNRHGSQSEKGRC